jgi:hypothetical protein
LSAAASLAHEQLDPDDHRHRTDDEPCHSQRECEDETRDE